MTTTAPQKAVHGTHWHYNGPVKPGMHLAIKAVAFAEVAPCALVYLCVELSACEHMYRCLFAPPPYQD